MRQAALAEVDVPWLDDDDELLVEDGESIPEEMPRTRGDCAEGMRPCPWVRCRFHLYLDVRADNVVRVNFADREPDEMFATCALDLAEDGPRTLEQVAGLMGMSKERARQIEEGALVKLKTHLAKGYIKG
jgi:hypothetical protein